MKSNERYFIGPGLRTKLREVITRVDGMPIGGGGGGGGEMPTRLQNMSRPSGDRVRLGTISATWDKGSEATVTQIKGNGDTITPTVEFTAKNWFAKVTVTTGTKKVACAKVDSTWILIAAEC